MQSQAAKLRAFLALATLLCFTGCTGLSQYREDVGIFEAAKRAYRTEPAAPKKVNKYSRHFERGWHQGYYNVTKGMGCCPPTTPPAPYWSFKYRNQDGGRKIDTWYAGFRHGASAAQRECRHLYTDVPIVASCQREEAGNCCPEEPLRSPPTEEEHVLPPLSYHDVEAKPQAEKHVVIQSSFNAAVEPTTHRLPDLNEEID